MSETDFYDHAACKEKPTDWFFSVHSGHWQTEEAAQAVAVCLDCPVQAECRTYARKHRLAGIWGAENEIERARATRRVPVGSASAASKRAAAIGGH